MNDIVKNVESFVEEAFLAASKETDVFHAKRTAYWVKYLRPDASDELIVSALAHDIERAFHGDWKQGSDKIEDLEKHQRLSAEEIGKHLKSIGSEESFSHKVQELVLKHEIGGTEDQNVLCDADCLAFLEEKASRLARQYKKEGRTDEFKKKLKFLWSRIHSEEAKKIGEAWFNSAERELN